jgi:hypothetical protein
MRCEEPDEEFWKSFDQSMKKKLAMEKIPHRPRLGLFLIQFHLKYIAMPLVAACSIAFLLCLRDSQPWQMSFCANGEVGDEFGIYAFESDDGGNERFFGNECCESDGRVFFTCETKPAVSHYMLTALEF